VFMAVGLVGLLPPATAAAQEDGVTLVNPSPSSPAGRQYEIPVERGRRDAAPTPKRGGSVPAEADVTVDGGYGTSPRVPGADSEDGARQRRRSEAQSGATRTATEPSRPDVVQVRASSTSGPDIGRTSILLVLALGLGAVLGVLARRATR